MLYVYVHVPLLTLTPNNLTADLNFNNKRKDSLNLKFRKLNYIVHVTIVVGVKFYELSGPLLPELILVSVA